MRLPGQASRGRILIRVCRPGLFWRAAGSLDAGQRARWVTDRGSVHACDRVSVVSRRFIRVRQTDGVKVRAQLINEAVDFGEDRQSHTPAALASLWMASKARRYSTSAARQVSLNTPNAA